MFKEITTAQVPQYAICYLEYGDTDGMNDDDLSTIDTWLAEFSEYSPLTFNWEKNAYGEIEASFNSFPQFGLPTDTVKVSIWGHK